MARKSKVVTIDAEGRDKGKQFVLTEMSARAAEAWATRALLGLSKAGVEVPDEAMDAGAAAIISFGARALTSMAWPDAEPLLAEMLACVQIVPNPSRPEVMRALIDDDTEEVGTLLKLRGEVVELHTGFSVAAALSTLGQAAKMRPSATSTSRKRSGRRSARASQRTTSSPASTG